MKLSPDSKLMQTLSRIADLMFLNLLFLATCLPVITIGAALTALYQVCFTIGTNRENGVIMSYLRAFRDSFGTATKVWLIVLAVCAALIADLVLCANLSGFFIYCMIPFGILLALAVLAAATAFPLLSLFRNTVMGTLKNAIILSLAHLPRTAAAAFLWFFPLIVLVRFPLALFNASFLLVFFYYSTIAYLSSLFLRAVFTPYLPEDTFQPDRPEEEH